MLGLKRLRKCFFNFMSVVSLAGIKLGSELSSLGRRLRNC